MTGLDRWVQDGFSELRGKSVGLLCNQASIDRNRQHVLETMRSRAFLRRVFGPQHGIFGHTQDNMIEWEGGIDPRTGLEVASLYGEHREPTREMLEGIEVLVIDLPDVGARYYTFIWTMMLCIRQCNALGIPVVVLDRPNPIGGDRVEGPMLEAGYESFVGLFSLPIRHGLTIGEVAQYLCYRHFPRVDLEVVQLENWKRSMQFGATGLPWAMPSPNMPTLDTAQVYPGGCLLEGTNISEGRGTTRPFETFGAPFLSAWDLCEALNTIELPGAYFRPFIYEPTFHKFAGSMCEGAFLHVTDRSIFEPVITYVAVIQEIVRQAPDEFAWRSPPYEYETQRMPIDILFGNSWMRAEIENLTPLDRIRDRMSASLDGFRPDVIYD